MTATLRLHQVAALPGDLCPEARRILAAYLDHHTAGATDRHPADAPAGRIMRSRYAPDLTRAAWSRGIRQLIAYDLFAAHRDAAGRWRVDVATDQPVPAPAPRPARQRTRPAATAEGVRP